jgi:hypothetical protein
MCFRHSSAQWPPLLAAVLIALGGCASQQVAPAEKTATTDDAAEAAMNRIVRRTASEENLSLIFDLLRRSITAAAEGKPPPELSAQDRARLEAGGKELQRDAVEASMHMLDQVEKEMRESIRNEPNGNR